MRLSRRAWPAVAFAVFVFIGLSVLLARALGGPGAERAAVLAVVQAEAKGDAAAALSHMPACTKEPACAQVTRERVQALRSPGRVAWRAGTALPTVQCVRVRRTGPLAGARVELLAISAPIRRESACP